MGLFEACLANVCYTHLYTYMSELAGVKCANPTRDLQATFSDVVPCKNLAVPHLLIIAESQAEGMNT